MGGDDPTEVIFWVLAGPKAPARDGLATARGAFLDVAPVMMHLTRQRVAVVTPTTRVPTRPLLPVPDWLVGPPVDDNRVVGTAIRV